MHEECIYTNVIYDVTSVSSINIYTNVIYDVTSVSSINIYTNVISMV